MFKKKYVRVYKALQWDGKNTKKVLKFLKGSYLISPENLSELILRPSFFPEEDELVAKKQDWIVKNETKNYFFVLSPEDFQAQFLDN